MQDDQRLGQLLTEWRQTGRWLVNETPFLSFCSKQGHYFMYSTYSTYLGPQADVAHPDCFQMRRQMSPHGLSNHRWLADHFTWLAVAADHTRGASGPFVAVACRLEMKGGGGYPVLSPHSLPACMYGISTTLAWPSLPGGGLGVCEMLGAFARNLLRLEGECPRSAAQRRPVGSGVPSG